MDETAVAARTSTQTSKFISVTVGPVWVTSADEVGGLVDVRVGGCVMWVGWWAGQQVGRGGGQAGGRGRRFSGGRTSQFINNPVAHVWVTITGEVGGWVGARAVEVGGRAGAPVGGRAPQWVGSPGACARPM